jgi:hypothetical protein
MNVAPPVPEVAGLSLDGAEPYVVTPEANRALCATLGSAPDPHGRAHPAFYFIATQVGMGLGVAGLCAACAFDVEDGPMLAGSKVAFDRPLMTGQPYLVRGEILGLTRKQSRKLGLMDLLEYRLRLVLPEGGRVLTATNLWVLPRGEPA